MGLTGKKPEQTHPVQVISLVTTLILHRFTHPSPMVNSGMVKESAATQQLFPII